MECVMTWQCPESEIRMHDGKPFFPNPLILIDFSKDNGPGRFQIDRSCQCVHFGLCTFFWENSFFEPTLAGMLDFLGKCKKQMTALAKSIDVNGRWTFVYWKTNKIMGSGKIDFSSSIIISESGFNGLVLIGTRKLMNLPATSLQDLCWVYVWVSKRSTAYII